MTGNIEGSTNYADGSINPEISYLWFRNSRVCIYCVEIRFLGRIFKLTIISKEINLCEKNM